MPSIELKFIPVGFVNPKSETGKTGTRYATDNPLSYSSRTGENKFYVVFSITKLEQWAGTPQLSYEILDETNNIILSGKRFFNQAGLDFYSKDRIDRASGIFLNAGEVLDTIEFPSPVKMIHGEAVIVANNVQVSNVVTFSMQARPTIGTGFQRGQAYQPPTEPTVVSGVKPFEKPERVSVFQPKKILSPQIKKIIDDWSVKKIIVPAWFANNNMNWVLEGRITEQEFLDAYTNLVNTGAITSTTPQVTITPIPEITIPSIPEVSAEMELITTNFQVKLDNKIQFSSSLSNADYKRLQDEMSLEPKITLVFLNQTDFNPLSNFSKILRQIQNLLQKQVVETITIGPTGEVITAPEPTVTPGKTGLMGAGVLGLIGILMLGGFIADHVRRKR